MNYSAGKIATLKPGTTVLVGHGTHSQFAVIVKTYNYGYTTVVCAHKEHNKAPGKYATKDVTMIFTDNVNMRKEFLELVKQYTK